MEKSLVMAAQAHNEGHLHIGRRRVPRLRNASHNYGGGATNRKAGVHVSTDSQARIDPGLILFQLLEQSRVYRQFVNANSRLLNQVAALKKQYGAKLPWLQFAPIFNAQEAFQKQKKLYGNRLTDLAKLLPVSGWVQGVKGFGLLNLALVLAETGDLRNYKNPQKLRKRMGLMPGQRRSRDHDKAIELGFNPRRRAIMHVIGDCLVKGNGKGKYKNIYNARKRYEKKRNKEMSNIHAHRRAMRVMEQKVLSDLWVEWKKSAALLPWPSRGPGMGGLKP